MADIRQTAANPLKDFIRATPRSPVLGYLADLAASTYSPQRTQQMQGVAQFFGAPAISQTLDRLAYGEPLTTGAGGLGGTTRFRPEVLEAGLALTDVLPTSTAAKLTAMAAPAIGGMFIGRKAKTWDALSAQRAKMLADMGTDPRTIWQQTGTWKGPDGKWRQEISDKPAFYDPEALTELKSNTSFNYLKDTQPLGGVVEHKELYKAYPDIGDIPVHFMPAENLKGAAGSYSRKNDRLTLADIPSDQKQITLHETQHAIQQREGFAGGGNPSQMVTTLEKIADQKRQKAQEMFRLSSANDPLDPLRIVKPGARKKGLALEKEARELDSKALDAYQSEQAKFDLYQRLAGEAEARAVEARMNMTPEQRRSMFPEESYDVPLNELIVRTD
jgi:hypothetical protein